MQIPDLGFKGQLKFRAAKHEPRTLKAGPGHGCRAGKYEMRETKASYTAVT